MSCKVSINQREYSTPNIPYEEWALGKLKALKGLIDKKLNYSNNPTVIVMEVGHFSLPSEDKNLDWAFKNIEFSNSLCGEIIKEYKSKYKIIPTLLVNNLDDDSDDSSKEIITNMLKNKKYINQKSLKIISERNLKNRAFKALKHNDILAESFIHIDGKAYLKDDDYQHDLAAGFVNEDGDIIPRCGLILTSFLDLVAKMAKERLHQNNDINVLFISLSQEFHEYQRVKLGVDIYSRIHNLVKIQPIVMHWDYNIDQALTSHRECDTKMWNEEDL